MDPLYNLFVQTVTKRLNALRRVLYGQERQCSPDHVDGHLEGSGHADGSMDVGGDLRDEKRVRTTVVRQGDAYD